MSYANFRAALEKTSELKDLGTANLHEAAVLWAHGEIQSLQAQLTEANKRLAEAQAEYDEDCPYCRPRQRYIRQILDERQTLETGLRNQLSELKAHNEHIANQKNHRIRTMIERIESLESSLSSVLEVVEELVADTGICDDDHYAVWNQAIVLLEKDEPAFVEVEELKDQLAEANKKVEELILSRGHLRHRFETIRGWCRAKDTLQSKYVLELLDAPLPIPTTDTKEDK
jgi:DNA repair exonuclease SbcCD ATPase subunit